MIAGVGAFILLKIVDVVVGLRVSEADEYDGLDITQHGESGYNLEEAFGTVLGGGAPRPPPPRPEPEPVGVPALGVAKRTLSLAARERMCESLARARRLVMIPLAPLAAKSRNPVHLREQRRLQPCR